MGTFHGKTRNTVKLLVDNLGCMFLAKNPEGHERSKHIDIQAHRIREWVAQRRVALAHCATEDMIADVMTKPLPRPKHGWCVAALRLKPLSLPPLKGMEENYKEAKQLQRHQVPECTGEIVGILPYRVWEHPKLMCIQG